MSRLSQQYISFRTVVLFLSPAEEAAEHVAHGLCRVLAGARRRLLFALLPNFRVGHLLVGSVENLFSLAKKTGRGQRVR